MVLLYTLSCSIQKEVGSINFGYFLLIFILYFCELGSRCCVQWQPMQACRVMCHSYRPIMVHMIACIIHAVHITLLRSISRSYLLPRFISLVSHFPLLVVSKNCHIMAYGHADTFLAWYDVNILLAQ